MTQANTEQLNAFVCTVCNMSEKNNLDYGEILYKNKIIVHYFCVVSSKPEQLQFVYSLNSH